MPTINEYLKYANLQMAAEAFLLSEFGLPFTDPVELSNQSSNQRGQRYLTS